MGRFRAGIFAAFLGLSVVLVLGTTYTYTRKEAAETIPATWNFSAGVKSPLRVAVDYTMATPSVAPTAVTVASAGSCVSGLQPYRFYYIPINESGTTGLSPASGDVSGFSAAGAPTGRATLTRGTLPSNAKGWVGAWSRQGSGEAHSIIRLCDSAISYEGAFKATGTTAFNCSCNASGLTISPTNQTGVKNHADINTIAQGYIGAATFAGGNFNFITEDAHRLDLSGATPRFSSDSGANYANLLLKNTKIVTICASGCDYTTLDSACATETSTAANPIIYSIGPGTYTSKATCSGEDHAAFIGSGIGVTTFDVAGLVSDTGGIETGTSTNFTIANMTIKAHRSIYTDGAGTGGGKMILQDLELIQDNNDANPDQDCWFGKNFAAGSELFYRRNINYLRSDCVTVKDTGANLKIYADNNKFYTVNPACNNNCDTGFYSFESSPALLDITGDLMVFNRNFGASAIRYRHTVAGASTAKATIRNTVLRLASTASNGANDFANFLVVESGATEATQIDLIGVDSEISTTDATTSILQNISIKNATTVVNIYNSRFRTTGGAINNLDLDGNVAGSIRIGPDSDYVTTDGNYTARLRSPSSTSPPSAECDEATEVGKLWWDTDADTDGQMFGCKGAAGWKAFGTGGGGGTPGGANTQVQFNDTGVFGGDAGMTYVKATDALTVVGTVTAGDFVTAATTAGSVVMSEASANGTESITLRSGAARTNSLIVDWPDINTTDTAALLAATQTFTNKTIDAEGTGNDITTVSKVWLPTATCQNATASINWDTPTTNAPQAACVTGTNTQKAYLDFDQATDESVQTVLALPADWLGNIDATYFWLTSATTATSVDWCLQIICVADAATDDPAFPAQAAGNCVSDAVKGVANQMNTATKTGITATGCTAGSIAHLKLSRDADGTGGTDDTLADARLVGVELTLRRKQ